MVTLYASNPEALENYSTRLTALFAEGRPTSCSHKSTAWP